MIQKSRVTVQTVLSEARFGDGDTLIEHAKLSESGVIVSTITPLLELKRNSYVRKAHSWFRTTYGIEVSDFVPRFQAAIQSHEIGDEVQEQWDGLRMAMDWAVFMAAAVAFVERESSDGEPGEWVEKAVPSEWENIESFFTCVPNDIFERGVYEAQRLNPGLWDFGTTEAQKKSVRVSSVK